MASIVSAIRESSENDSFGLDAENLTVATLNLEFGRDDENDRARRINTRRLSSLFGSDG